MTDPMIPLSTLLPAADDRDQAERVYARRATLDDIDRATAAYTGTYGETLADAIDAGDVHLAAVAVRSLVAHARARCARRAELEAAAGGGPALRSRVPGAAWAAWRRSTVTAAVEGDQSDAAAGGAL